MTEDQGFRIEIHFLLELLLVLRIEKQPMYQY